MTGIQTTESDVYASARDAVDRLGALLNNPHPGLVTWHIAVAAARLEVLKELHYGDPQTTEASARIKRYLAIRDSQPISQSSDIIHGIHGIHGGTQWEADLLLSDLRAVTKEFQDTD